MQMVDQDETRKRALEAHLGSLRGELSEVAYATARAENSAMEAELKQALGLLQQSKTTEARAYAGLKQLEAQAAAQRKEADTAAKALQQARTEGEQRLEEAVADADSTKAESVESLKKARQSLEFKC